MKKLITAALLASAVAAPAEAADLSFIFATTATGPSVYVSGSGKLTIDEASGNNGRYNVTAVVGSYIAGILQADNNLTSRNDGPLTLVGANSFISFAADGTVTDYSVGLSNEGQVNISLVYDGGVSRVGFGTLGGFRAIVSIEGFVPPVAPPTTAVPEPATWTMMIGGFGLVGGAMRRRRGTSAITYA